MGLVLSMLVAATSMLAVNTAPPDPSSNSFAEEVATINRLLFDLDLRTFANKYTLLRRANRALDWTTDGCSAPVVGDSGRSFNFRWPCLRHDFGYRNFKSHGLFNSESRLRVDEQLHRDLEETCAPRLRTFKLRCMAWAEIFYTLVRAGGGP